MKQSSRKDSLSKTIIILAIIIITEIFLHVCYGFYSSGNIILIFLLSLIAILRYAAIVCFAVIVVWQIIKRETNNKLILLGLLLLVIGQIPKLSFDNIGSIFALYRADFTDILVDTRQLFDDYPPMSCFVYDTQRPLCDDQFSLNNLPISLQKAHVGNVLIMDDYIFLEKFGMVGVFRGYVVFKNNTNVWSDQPIFVHGKCIHCWKIRITEGLYWYSADPSSYSTISKPLE